MRIRPEATSQNSNLETCPPTFLDAKKLDKHNNAEHPSASCQPELGHQ
jgi:hypothetical protein